MADDTMPAMPTAIVYVQDAGGYVGQHVLAAIRARNAEWDGGAEIPAPSDDDPSDVTRRLVVYDPVVESVRASPEQCVAASDLIVVNLFGDLDEAAALIKAARAATLTRPKHLVCLSTALTWAGAAPVAAAAVAAAAVEPTDTGTDGDSSAAPTPGPAASAPIDETQFRGRQPAPACSRQKLLETLVVNSVRDRMTTAVLAAGVLYGDGEADLHALFKQAWLHRDPSLPIIGPGTNHIPTIHVADYATACIRYMERPPSTRPYVVIVDKAHDTQQAIVTAISKMLSTGTTTSITELDAVGRRDLIAPHIATADVTVARETAWIGESVQMEWRCEQGLVAHIGTVVTEYLTARNLHPIRVAVIGPPGSGRSYWARRIATHFYLPLVSVRDLIARAKQSGADLQLDKNGRAPAAVVAALVQSELNRNEIRNKGYVLDGYPRSSEEARLTFPTPGADSDGTAADSDAKEPDSDAADPSQRHVPIIPDRIVSITAPDALILSRARENATDAIPGHSDEKGIQRRLTAWNKSVAASADHHPRTYFTSTTEIFDVNAADPAPAGLDLVQAYIGGSTPPYNYHPTEEEVIAAETARKEQERVQRELELERERQHQAELERQAQEHARKAAEREALLQQLARAEADLVADRSRPLRQYLGQHVVPVVVEGLYEIARVRPDDPIDYLAEYLFRASSNMNRTPPGSGSEPSTDSTSATTTASTVPAASTTVTASI